ncbi:fimbria/pilus outer membrane usher protein [Herbaspirillum rhizosphaerae]|uniref:fimbria/pilus outer membrane usher protein n=1 Tax=Herbaspirillum rhizosphaerae TaxID=346179 RepID=UPI00067E07F6|nr:fimbria/pilus outer membrane usher protein [Herbaspirillum rhizosphaerae]
MGYVQKKFQLKPVCTLVLMALAVLESAAVYAEKPSMNLAQVEFGNEFLQFRGGAPVDVSRFSKGNVVIPGSYPSDIYVNGTWLGRVEVLFRSTGKDAATGASPCMDRALLDMAGVDFEKMTPEALASLQSGKTAGNCLQIQDLIPDATATYDSADLRLDFSVPQISLRRSARGYISPEFWDKGINAGILGYNFNAYRSSSGSTTNTSYYLGLNGGINLGDWHLRNSGSFTKQSGSPTRYQNIATYLQRDIVPLKSQLIIGDSFTSGELFDSVGFRGVRLASDDRMLPDSQNGYAPIVRGVARTNARIRITQNGNLIYETTVAPGQFEINDLYPTGYGGDLRVEVTEADGSQSSFIVPYASIVQLLRPGVSRYAITAGQTRNVGLGPSISFMESTYQRGITNDITLFGGGIIAADYLAAIGGSAFSTPIGAVSFSLTQSHAKVSDRDVRDGQSFRADYSKFLKETNTNFSLAAYRYSSSGYMRLADLQLAKSLQSQGVNLSAQDRQRSQLQLIINQSLGSGNGSLYLSGATQNYWNRPGSNTQYNAGYSNTWRQMSYNVSVQRQKDLASGTAGTLLYASLSFPLGQEIHSPRITTSASRDSRSGTTLQTSVTGTAGDDNALSYGATGSKDGSGSKTASANVQYSAPYANLGANVSAGSTGSAQSVQVSGGLVVHAGGITLSQTLGETIGIVEAKNAEGAQVNTAGVRVDGRGYAIVPYLTAYRINEIAIDPKGTSTDVELAVTSQRVAPHAGAVVMLKYPTVSGRSVLINVKLSNGDPLPFGAEAFDEQGNSVGMSGQGGSIFVRTAEADTGKLTIKWGSKDQDQCRLNYQLPARDKDAKGMVYDSTTAVCTLGRSS